ncbi:hypothetical protein JW948_00400 [bacterium]|nr:hypothetical protein [bacterium]
MQRTFIGLIILILVVGIVSAQMTVKDSESNVLMQVNDEGTVGSISLSSGSAPSSTDDKLYNQGGTLYWDGSALGTAGSAGGWTDDGTVVRLGTDTDNVGIGTTSPSGKLEVAGSRGSTTISEGNSLSITSNYTPNGDAAINLFCVDNTASESYVSFRRGGIMKWCLWNPGSDSANFHIGTSYNVAATKLIVKSNGNVGIGTTSPAQKLDIAGTAQMTGFKLPTGASSNYVLTSDAAGVGTWQSLAAISTDGDWTISGSDLYSTVSGNVGIGTTSPNSKLEVTGRIKGEGAALIVNDVWEGISIPNSPSGGSVNGAGDWGVGPTEWLIGNSYDGSWMSQPSTGLNFLHHIPGSTVSSVMYLATDGKVGIGTTSPAGTLDVYGSIYQSGGVLHADYVFEEDYELESIEEHAKFMWGNKHLKSIPKLKTNEDGQEIVEIGSHRKGIVEELEKAHIYIEQLNKKIEIQQKSIQEQQIQIKTLRVAIEAMNK